MVFNDALFWHLARRHWSNSVGEWVDDYEENEVPNIAYKGGGETRCRHVAYSCRRTPRGPLASEGLSEGRYNANNRIPPQIHAVERLISKASEVAVLTFIPPTSLLNRTGHVYDGHPSNTWLSAVLLNFGDLSNTGVSNTPRWRLRRRLAGGGGGGG